MEGGRDTSGSHLQRRNESLEVSTGVAKRVGRLRKTNCTAEGVHFLFGIIRDDAPRGLAERGSNARQAKTLQTPVHDRVQTGWRVCTCLALGGDTGDAYVSTPASSTDLYKSGTGASILDTQPAY